jgi:hypothetical protein
MADVVEKLDVLAADPPFSVFGQVVIHLCPASQREVSISARKAV